MSPYATPNNPHKLTLFSGHDTVIAPVLSALGVYRHQTLCHWPQYASRIVFELWERRTPDPTTPEEITGSRVSKEEIAHAANYYLKKAPQMSSPTSSAAAAFSESELAQLADLSKEAYFVRVIYNGRDVTELIPTCQQERAQFARAIASQQYLTDSDWIRLMLHNPMNGKFPLCTLKSFTRQIKQMISPHETISEACDWKH